MKEVVQTADMPGYWLDIPGDGASGTHSWLLLLANLALSSSCSQLGLGEWMSMLSRPFITSDCHYGT